MKRKSCGRGAQEVGTASTKALRWEHGQGMEEWWGWSFEPIEQRGKKKVHPPLRARLNLSPWLPSMSPSLSAPWQVDKFMEVMRQGMPTH